MISWEWERCRILSEEPLPLESERFEQLLSEGLPFFVVVVDLRFTVTDVDVFQTLLSVKQDLA